MTVSSTERPMLRRAVGKGVTWGRARLDHARTMFRLRFDRWQRDLIDRLVLRHLRSPETQQRFAHDLVRGSPNPLVGTESFAFMCHVLGWCRASKSQLWQDVWALHRTGFRREGFFVDIGASDGVQWSNSYLLEKTFGWTGILVEPNPMHREALRAGRSSRVHHGCVAAASGEEVAFWCAQDDELSGIGRYAEQDGHTASRREHTTIRLTTISLNDLLGECNAPQHIDYVSLDTEGSELDILSTFDFARYRVKLWTVEHNHTANEAKIDRLMQTHGYRREFPEWSQFDAWYVAATPASTPSA